MAKKESKLTTGISEPQKLQEFMDNLKHPLAGLAAELRTLILGAGQEIGEGIYWNAPAFFYTGSMKPFEPKEYKRYIVGFNLYRQEAIRLIFLRGASATDPGRILEGEFKDGRRIAHIKSLADLKEKEKALKNIIKELVDLMDR